MVPCLVSIPKTPFNTSSTTIQTVNYRLGEEEIQVKVPHFSTSTMSRSEILSSPYAHQHFYLRSREQPRWQTFKTVYDAYRSLVIIDEPRRPHDMLSRCLNIRVKRIVLILQPALPTQPNSGFMRDILPTIPIFSGPTLKFWEVFIILVPIRTWLSMTPHHITASFFDNIHTMFS